MPQKRQVKIQNKFKKEFREPDLIPVLDYGFDPELEGYNEEDFWCALSSTDNVRN